MEAHWPSTLPWLASTLTLLAVLAGSSIQLFYQMVPEYSLVSLTVSLTYLLLMNRNLPDAQLCRTCVLQVRQSWWSGKFLFLWPLGLLVLFLWCFRWLVVPSRAPKVDAMAWPFCSSVALHFAASAVLEMLSLLQGQVFFHQKPLLPTLVTDVTYEMILQKVVESCTEVAVFRHLLKFANEHHNTRFLKQKLSAISKWVGWSGCSE